MSQEDKQLLFKDLCARLPYGVKLQRNNVYDSSKKEIEFLTLQGFQDIENHNSIELLNIKPYLRPMSSMTEEEVDEWAKASNMKFDMEDGFFDCYDAHLSVDWLNAHHFDYRGLIEKGLAIEAPEGMYN